MKNNKNEINIEDFGFYKNMVNFTMMFIFIL